jgi:hypothetical protein
MMVDVIAVPSFWTASINLDALVRWGNLFVMLMVLLSF